MTEKTPVTADAVALAGLFSSAAMSQVLIRKGVLTTDEANEFYAVAASMCRANGSEMAAKVIELMVPTSVGVDFVELAKQRGDEIKRDK